MRTARTVVFEAALVAILGLVFALAANALSPRGLRLTRDYFPMGERGIASASPEPGLNAGITNVAIALASGSSNPLETTLQRLQQHGLQVINSNGVAELFSSMAYEQGLSVLIDARDNAHFEKGHIPGAWPFDHYHAEQFLPALLPVCLSAQKVVVYCTGGACEDSEFAAVVLRDAGVPRDNIFVYAGGITEWSASGRAVETGARRSGQLVKANPE